MAVFIAGQTVVAYKPTSAANPDGVRYSGDWEAAGRRIVCQVAPMTASTVFDRFGVEVRQGYQLLADPSEAPHLPVGAKVYWEDAGVSLMVRTSQKFVVGGGADHLEVLLELI